MQKKLCAAALMLGMGLMLLQLRAHAGDGQSGMTQISASITLADDDD